MQKYPRITELFACTRKILTFMFLFPGNSSINSLTSSEICSPAKLLKWTISFLLQNKAIQCVLASEYSSTFITDTPSFIFLGKLFLEKAQLNLGSFW